MREKRKDPAARARDVERSTRYYREHQAEVSEKMRAWYSRTRPERLAVAKAWKDKNRDRVAARARARALERQYGLTPQEYRARLEEQGGRCAICGATDPKTPRGSFCVDHDHATGKVRELLCLPCNTALGGFRDNVASMRAAIAYLERHAAASRKAG